MSALSRFNVQITGQGAHPIIFSHGFGCDQSVWHAIAPAFERDYTVIRYDLVGARPSNRAHYDPAKYSNLDAYASDVLALMDALDISKAHFVGHSVSAMIGVHAAVASPARFESLTLIAPSPCYLNDGPYRGGLEPEELDGLLGYLESNYVAWANAMAPQIMGNTARPTLAADFTEILCKTDPDIARNFARVVFKSDSRRILAKLRCPSLIMQCADDLLAPVQVGQYLRDAMAASTLVQMRAKGHCPHLSEPEETVDCMSQFLHGLQ